MHVECRVVLAKRIITENITIRRADHEIIIYFGRSHGIYSGINFARGTSSEIKKRTIQSAKLYTTNERPALNN